MENKTYQKYINSPIGWLKIITSDDSVQNISFQEKGAIDSENPPQIIQETEIQLNEYFNGTRKIFNLKLNPAGTEFQKTVWRFVEKVDFGKTTSYLKIAIQTGSEKNTRAVGMANGKNPIPIVIPCHRIIGTNGKLTGYAGGLQKKRWLLQREIQFSKNKTLLF